MVLLELEGENYWEVEGENYLEITYSITSTSLTKGAGFLPAICTSSLLPEAVKAWYLNQDNYVHKSQ